MSTEPEREDPVPDSSSEQVPNPTTGEPVDAAGPPDESPATPAPLIAGGTPAVVPVARPAAASGLQPVESEETLLLYDLIGDAHLLTVVVLIGASALIPVPFLDDVAKAYLERRLLRTVAEREKMTLASEEVDRLTKEPAQGCCLWGCLGQAFFYPIKKVLRKIFFFLEIKRSVDQSSTALAEAWLFALALRRGLWSPGRDIGEADRLREVMEASCHSHGVKPLETAFHHVFTGAKSTIVDFANRFTGKKGDDKAQLDAAVSKLEAEESERLAKLSSKLQEALSGVSESYLLRFAQQFEKELAAASARPPHGPGAA